jgi:hypothetical protein
MGANMTVGTGARPLLVPTVHILLWEPEHLKMLTIDRRLDGDESRLARAAREEQNDDGPPSSDDHGS